jgi:hypothetical protein
LEEEMRRDRESRKFREALKWKRRVPRGSFAVYQEEGKPPKRFELRNLQIPEPDGRGWSSSFELDL